ncbi:Dihydroneopterin aldolase-domain-containing protein [Xylogone sp. PMI_703]|nr:Dihydroneopterin aldolase-domain-containing protein [Xylogone sp. PMI_703]
MVDSPALLCNAWELTQGLGEPTSVIRVRNLQAFLTVGKDAWARDGIPKPVLLSASVSLRQSFHSASTNDAVNKSTIHYGILSKQIIGATKIYQQHQESSSELRDLKSALNKIASTLTRYTLDGIEVVSTDSPILSHKAIRSLELEVTLPKASLTGTGVSLKGVTVYTTESESPVSYSLALKLRDLHVPCLIGVNSVEREAKQMVVANVEIDRWTSSSIEHNRLEELIVKTMEESSFQTLEALATQIGRRIVTLFINALELWGSNPRIKICLEKPIAVPFADSPAVELTLDTHPDRYEWKEDLRTSSSDWPIPPFPLQNRLDEWIATHTRADLRP